MEERILREVADLMEEHPEKAGRYSLVFVGEGWHRGVIGIVAQRVVERYHRPTLVIGVEDGIGVGSGRSIPGFHLLEALTHSADLFERYGGHAQAAGFAIAAERVPELEARFESYARSALGPEDLEPVLRVDAELGLTEVNRGLYEGLRKLGPHGVGNPAPVFAAPDLHLVGPPRVLKEKHLKLRLGQGTKSFEAVAWGSAELAMDLAPGDTVDAAFTLEDSSYGEFTTLQLVIRDIRRTGG